MNIVITGAGKGIGLATVKELLKNNKNVILAISRNIEQLTALQKQHNNVIPIQFDLVNENINSSLLPKIKLHVGNINVLVNNAGSLVNKPFETISTTELESVYKTNVIAPFYLTQQLMPLIQQSQGLQHIVNISSIGGITGTSKFPGLSAYSSSKAALAVLTEVLASEYANTNIKFNCLALGAVQTEMLSLAFPSYTAPITPEQIAVFIADFALNGAKYFNGKVIPVSKSNP